MTLVMIKRCLFASGAALTRPTARRQSRNRLAPVVGLSLAMITAVGCGRAKPAEPQFRGTLPVPDYPAEPSPFNLTDAQGALVLDMSVIYWTPDPTPEQVRGILDGTRDARHLKADALTYLTGKSLPAKKAVATAQSEYDAFDPQIAAASKNVDQKAQRAYVAEVASTLVEDRLTDLVTSHNITAGDKTYAEDIWPAYCEAKLWELATIPDLGRRYLSRPTPVQLCEKYYATQKYFADATLCGPAADATGKDYFQCIWHEGVLKSALFNHYRGSFCAGASGTTYEQALTTLLGSDGGALKAILLPAAVADAAAMSQATQDAQAMQQFILNGDFISFSFTRHHPAVKACRSLFTRSEPPRVHSTEDVSAWGVYKPNTLLAIGEASDTDSPAFSLLPLTDNADTNKIIYAKLTKYVKLFSERKGAAHDVPSYSDETFNQVVGAPLVADKADHDAVVNDPVFSGLRNFETPALKALKAQQAQAFNDLTKAKADYARVQKAYTEQAKGIDANRQATITVSQAPGASVYLNTYVLTVQKIGDQLTAKMQFTLATKTLLGCVNVVDGSQCPVAAADLGSNGVVANVAFDAASNLISVKFVLADPPAYGFPVLPLADGAAQFNNIPQDQLRGRTVQIDHYANMLDTLNIIAGNAYILDAAQNRAYSGSLTGDNFYQQEKAIISANGL